MPSERVQRQIDRLLDQTEEAIGRQDWTAALTAAEAALGLDPDNPDARSFVSAAERALAVGAGTEPAATLVPLENANTQPADAVWSARPSEPRDAAAPVAFCEGRYQVRKFLGEGGKKKVYLAADTRLDRDVAFALIKTDGLDEVGRERVRREAQAMGRLGAHPHVVSVFDVGEEGGQQFIVTELMGGGDVEGLIEKATDHRVPLADAIRIANQVCLGLEFAHSKGVIHRDLKPGNVWLTADGTAKLGDFGLAVSLDRTRLTQAGMMVGTVSYMPPEQAIGGEVTPRSDLYSLGAMLYELVTGRPPFVGDESVAIITQHLNTPPVAPSWHVPGLPSGLEGIILRLLEKDPARRPATAGEVREALANVDRGDALAAPAGPAVLAETENPLYRRAFVGREGELRQLQQAFDAALSGQGSLVAVVGEPGIGKTALCEQIATYVAVRGGRTLVGHCYEEGSLSLPYLPFIEALRSYVLTRDPEGLAKDLGSGAAEVARIVSEVRDRIPVDLRPSSADPDEDRWRLYQALSGFLHNASTVQPLLIILEDLHWADRGTLDLLVFLARQLTGARLLIVGNYRDVEVDRAHPLSGTLAELRRGSTFRRIPLRGLTADEVQRMMSTIAGQNVSYGLSEAVHRQTEGNPLFVQEVLRYLAEEGLVQRADGRWQRTGSTPIELQIPEGLRDVIGKRLSRLSAECNRVLSIAAVIGRDFELRTLRSVTGLDEESVAAVLEEATKVGVIEDQTRAGVLRFRFAHAFFRQTLYEELFSARRLRFHQEVARALERQYASRLDEHASELAEHFAQSTDPDDLRKAVRYGELGARRALGVYAYGEAARLLERALEAQEVLDPDDGAKRCDLLLALADALGPAGEPDRAANEVAEEAFALAERLGDRERAAAACEAAIEAIMRSAGGTYVTAPSFPRWVKRMDGAAPPSTLARVRADVWLAEVMRREGTIADARALATRAFEAATQLSDTTTLVRAAASGPLSALGAGWAVRQFPERVRVAHESLTWSLAGVDGRTVRTLFEQRSRCFAMNGERELAEADWRRIAELAERSRDPDTILASMGIVGQQKLMGGDLAGALGVADNLRDRAHELGTPRRADLIIEFLRSTALYWLGRAEEAVELSARPPSPYAGDQLRLSTGRRELYLARAGRTTEAKAALTEVIGSVGLLTGVDEIPVRILAALLETAVLVEDRDTAALLATTLAGVPAIDGPLTGLGYQVANAFVLPGDRESAATYYQRSLDWTKRVGYRPEAALTLLALAELELGGGAEERAAALGHLDLAIDELRAMKMQPALERALRHKGVLRA